MRDPSAVIYHCARWVADIPLGVRGGAGATRERVEPGYSRPGFKCSSQSAKNNRLGRRGNRARRTAPDPRRRLVNQLVAGGGGATAQVFSVAPGISVASMRSSDTQNEIFSPTRSSENFVSLPLILIFWSGPGFRLNVSTTSPFVFSRFTVVISGPVRYTLASNFA